MNKEKYEPNEEDIIEMIDALGNVANGSLHAELPDGARDYLKSMFDELDKKNREFASGNIALNPEAFRIFRKDAIFLKSMQLSGHGSVDTVDDSPSVMASRIRFRSPGFVLSGDALEEFASCVEQSTSTEIYPETDGCLCVDFSVANMWRKIDLGGEKEDK